METLNKGMATGAMWAILFRFATRGIGLLSTVILARLLIPADFGLIAMAMAFIAALEVLAAFNFDVVLIQNRHTEDRHYNTAWTFNFILASVQAVILFLSAPLLAAFYNEPRLQMVIYALSIGRVIGAFENIGMVTLRKELQFEKEFRFQIIRKLAGFTVTMGLAFWLGNYWALIGGTLAGQAVGVILSYALHPYRPKFSLSALAEMLNFSKWLVVNNCLYFAIHQSSSFILGKLGGAQALGLFTVSYEISNLPSTDLVAPINRAIFPGYAKMSRDMRALSQGFLNVLSAVALFVLPIGAGIILLAEPLVYLMLGNKWGAAIPLVQVLSVAGVIGALQSNQGSVYLALGRPKTLTLVAALHAVCLLPMLLWGAIENGAMGAAQANVVVSAALMPINSLIVIKILKLRISTVMGVLWRPLVATGVMILGIRTLFQFLPAGSDPFSHAFQLVLSTIVGAILYAASIMSLWKVSGMKPGIEEIFFSKVKRSLQRVSRTGEVR